MKKKIVVISVMVIAISITIFMAYRFYRYENSPWYEKYSMVSHAMGSIDNILYSNSLEAFEQSYEKGFRVFEVDLRETVDGVLVGRHKWNEKGVEGIDSYEEIPTSEEYLSSKIAGKYTPLSLADILVLADKYPDIYFITDTKAIGVDENNRIMQEMQSVAKELGLEDVLRERFVIQIYTQSMYDIVQEWIRPENIAYTLYKTKKRDYKEVFLFCEQNNIPIVIIDSKRWTKKRQKQMEKLGLKVGVHTVDDEDQAGRLMYNGVRCIYTNSIDPNYFKVIKFLFG